MHHCFQSASSEVNVISKQNEMEVLTYSTDLPDFTFSTVNPSTSAQVGTSAC